MLYGSSHLAAITCDLIKQHYDIVGHVPSKNPRIPGTMNCKKIDNEFECDYDIKLSIQYDQKIIGTDNAFNIHTGLLPDWGGCDILYHTIKNDAVEQGITFHKMTDKFDYGPIISKITYPVIKGDSVVTLYKRLASVLPWFVLSSLQLLETLEPKDIPLCHKEKPKIFKKEKDIKEKDMNKYRKNGTILKELYGTATNRVQNENI